MPSELKLSFLENCSLYFEFQNFAMKQNAVFLQLYSLVCYVVCSVLHFLSLVSYIAESRQTAECFGELKYCLMRSSQEAQNQCFQRHQCCMFFFIKSRAVTVFVVLSIQANTRAHYLEQMTQYSNVAPKALKNCETV